MKVQVWSDFSCPFCYIGKTRLEKALRNNELDDKIDIEFKSYQLNPMAPQTTELNALAAFAKEKHMPQTQVKTMFENVTSAFHQEGINVDMERLVMTNTFNAHRVAKLARTHEKENELTAALMKAYFEDGQNLADTDTLVSLAKSVGLDEKDVRKTLESHDYHDLVNTEISQAHAMGVRGVPFFVINGKYSISGAQPQTLFEQAILQAWNEEHPVKPLGTENESLCSDDSCSI